MRGTQLLAVGVLCVAAESASATPAPVIPPGTRTIVAFAGGPAKVSLGWQAIEGVSRYRARWTDSGATIDIELPGTATAFERDESTPGRHVLSVVAIDAAGRESAPAEAAFDVVAISALAPGDEAPVSAARTAFAIGTRFTSPGMTCQLDAQEPGTRILRCAAESGPRPRVTDRGGPASEPGRPRVTDRGGPASEPGRLEVPVVIVPVIVDGPHRALVRGRATRIHITVASVAHLGERIALESTGDLDLGEIERTETGLAVTVTPHAAAAVAGIVVRASGLELGRVELELRDADPPAPRPIARRARWFALDLGARAGTFVLPSLGNDAIALGEPTQADHTLTTAPMIGAHLGWFPSHHAGLEVAAALMTPRYAGQSGFAGMLLYRAQIAARIVDDGPYGLRLLGGADLLALISGRGTSQRDAAGGVHYGAAFSIQAWHDASVRLEALHVMTPALDAGYAHAVELSLGVVAHFGRVDP